MIHLSSLIYPTDNTSNARMDPSVFPLPDEDLSTASIYSYNTSQLLPGEEDDTTTFSYLDNPSTTSSFLFELEEESQRLMESILSKSNSTVDDNSFANDGAIFEVLPADAAIGIFLTLLGNAIIATAIILKKQALRELHVRCN